MQEIEIKKIKIGNRFRKQIGSIDTLCNSIQKVGLLHPIRLDEKNNLVAGFRRIKAFENLGRKQIPFTREFIEDTKLGEFHENTIRKDFVPTEIAEIHRVIEEDRINHRPIKGGKLPPLPRGKTRDIVARMTGNSPRQIDKMIHIVNYGNRDLIDKVDTKKKSVDKAYKEIIKNQKQEELNKLSDDLPKEIRVIHGDFREVGKQIEPNSIELIFTDPPYLESNIGIYADLAKFAKRVLKTHGSLLTYCNQGQIDKILDFVTPHLDYWWIITIKLQGSFGRVWKQGVVVKCKPLLWFVKGGKRINPKGMIDDFIESSTTDKTFHEWTQSPKEAEFIIRQLTNPGGRVCDPFLGSGTTGIAAKKAKRSFVGIEIDKTHFENSKRLIGNAK